MPLLSVIIPIFDEERNLPAFLENLRSSTCPIEREFIFVDDGSRDRSLEIVSRFDFEVPCHIVRLKGNRGKGVAIGEGIGRAWGDFIMIQDADLEYDPNDVGSLLEPLLDNRADVVYGSRFKQNAPQVHRTYHYFINRFLTLLSNLLSGIYLTDMETCYKLFRADLLKSMNLKSRRFGIEVELTACIARTSARIFELPISYHPRTRLQGKKISWKDGLAALYHLVDFNLLRSTQQCFTDLPERYRPRA